LYVKIFKIMGYSTVMLLCFAVVICGLVCCVFHVVLQTTKHTTHQSTDNNSNTVSVQFE
jgi:hypothetical protein